MESQYDFKENIIWKLTRGEKVICPKCKKSILLAANPNVDPAKCHGFYCPQCDFRANWDPVVVIE